MTATRTRRISIALAPLLALVCVAPAAAQDRIYWLNAGSQTISFASLDGIEAGTLDTGGLPVGEPSGLAIDTVHQQIYWSNAGTDRIAFTSLLGLGGENAETGELTVDDPRGLALDPVAERIYWGNREEAGGGSFKIALASLDGSFGTTFENLGGANIAQPTGTAVDPLAGRVYWSNSGTPAVSYVNLDGSGGGNINDAGATNAVPVGVAVNHADERVYWANLVGTRISYAKLDGSGGGDLATGAATVLGPEGVAVDPVGGRIYWANRSGGKISYANLDGSGGGDLSIPAAQISLPSFPVLFFAPRPTSPPTITGTARVGSTLSCSAGGWAPDALESFLYRPPRASASSGVATGPNFPAPRRARLPPRPKGSTPAASPPVIRPARRRGAAPRSGFCRSRSGPTRTYRSSSGLTGWSSTRSRSG
jgi:hypothetical protein